MLSVHWSIDPWGIPFQNNVVSPCKYFFNCCHFQILHIMAWAIKMTLTLTYIQRLFWFIFKFDLFLFFFKYIRPPWRWRNHAYNKQGIELAWPKWCSFRSLFPINLVLSLGCYLHNYGLMKENSSLIIMIKKLKIFVLCFWNKMVLFSIW